MNRLSFHDREDGHELGAVEVRDGIAIPTNDYAARRMKITLGHQHHDARPEQGSNFLAALFEHYRRSSGVAVKSDAGHSQGLHS
jgi:hypothetical protein